ncbi:MAG: hypothetical protein J6B45_03470 [Clostridia bacterium]|nr:hypothetical protein [Clostridia bacterium]
MSNKTVIARARDAYPGELDIVEKVESLPYKDRVIARIRAVYSVDDEIAIIRQRDTKPLEFEEYNKFVEQVKAEEKER